MKLINKSLPLVLLTVILAFIVWRSVRQTTVRINKLEYALKLAGKNRAELEKVLTHYKNDSLKHRAAVFLIENMPYYVGEEWVALRKRQIDTTFSLTSFKSSIEALRVMDSLHISFSLISRRPDVTAIKSTFLINNIDKAFCLWNQPWAKHLNFSEFCNYLLPYRIDSEPLDDYRAYLSIHYDSLFQAARNCTTAFDAACIINFHLLKDVRWHSQMTLYPGKFTAKKMSQIKMGDCNHLSDFGLKVFRTFGIPIANDYVTAWGDNDGAHSWTVAKLDGVEVPFVACDVQPSEFSFFYRPAKIWRKEFAEQTSDLELYKSKNQEIPPELEDKHSIDVTDSYYSATDLDVLLIAKPPKENNCAFLCVYNHEQWVPVDWGKISADDKFAHFKNINDSLLYCVSFYNQHRLSPASNPFFLSEGRSIKYFFPDNQSLFNFRYEINSPKPEKEYNLFVWSGEWKKISTISPKLENGKLVVDFNGIPSGFLYRVNDKSRPFWFIDGKLVRSERRKPFAVKKLKQKFIKPA